MFVIVEGGCCLREAEVGALKTIRKKRGSVSYLFDESNGSFCPVAYQEYTIVEKPVIY